MTSTSFCPDCEEEVAFLTEDPVCQVCGAHLEQSTATSDAASTQAETPMAIHDILASAATFSSRPSATEEMSALDVADDGSWALFADAAAAQAGSAAALDHSQESPSSQIALQEDGAAPRTIRDLFQNLFSQADALPHLNSRTPAASNIAVKQLTSRKVARGDRWLEQVHLEVCGIAGNIIVETAGFGCSESKLKPGTSLTLRLVAARPYRANRDFENPARLAQKAVLCERGGCTFSAKALNCQRAGAAAVIVAQTVNVWPYEMTDSTGQGDEVRIPTVMVKREHGAQLLSKLTDGNFDEEIGLEVKIVAGAKNVVCPICFEEIENAVCTQLPCLHVYHSECIEKWLGMRSTCPTCRYQLPTDDAAFNEEARRNRNRSRENAIDFWYS